MELDEDVLRKGGRKGDVGLTAAGREGLCPCTGGGGDGRRAGTGDFARGAAIEAGGTGLGVQGGRKKASEGLAGPGNRSVGLEKGQTRD